MQRTLPSGGVRGLFGWHTVPDAADTLVMTEGEFDAMAVHQETGRPCVSVPNGASSFTPDLLPALKRFKRIVLWYDEDQAGKEGAERAAHKLGIARCTIVRLNRDLLARARKSPSSAEHGGVEPHAAGAEVPAAPLQQQGKPPKDANDLMLQGYDLQTILDAAEPIRHEQVLSFEDLREDVRLELATGEAKRGVHSRAFPTLNKVFGGLRRGELTVVTGPTGCGKTTFLSQLSMDYCLQGVPTLWGSFEIKNTRLIGTMIKVGRGATAAPGD
jgi:twinkle protein